MATETHPPLTLVGYLHLETEMLRSSRFVEDHPGPDWEPVYTGGPEIVAPLLEALTKLAEDQSEGAERRAQRFTEYRWEAQQALSEFVRRGGAPTPASTSDKARTLKEMARQFYDLTNELNAVFARLSSEVRRRRAAGISDARTCEQLDLAADTPERKEAQAQVERVLGVVREPGGGLHARTERPVAPETLSLAEDYATGRRPVR